MILKSLLLNLVQKVQFKKAQKTLTYSDQLVRSIMLTTFIKKKFNYLFIMFCCVVIRTLIAGILCYLFQINPILDFILHCVIYIVIILNSDFLFDVLMTRKQAFYRITKYVINNLTLENYKRWKRNAFLTLSTIAILFLSFVEINSLTLIYYIVQNVVIYCIVDIIENNKIREFMKHLRTKQPKQIQYSKLSIIDDYYDISNHPKDTDKDEDKVEDEIDEIGKIKNI